MNIEDIAGPMPENGEGTAHPYWMIIDPQQMMRPDLYTVASMFTGPYFSREDAAAHLNGRRYAFGKNAKVFCCSGYWSKRWQLLCEERKAAACGVTA
jgi:hypothetical protein